MNKKAQYYQEPRPSYSAISPVFIIGIVMFCLPFVMPVFGVNMPNFIDNVLYGLGVIIILVGGMLSVYNAG